MLIRGNRPWFGFVPRPNVPGSASPPPVAWDPTDEPTLAALYRNEDASPFLSRTAALFVRANLEGLSAADAAWNTPSSEDFWVGAWVLMDAASTGEQTIVAKSNSMTNAAITDWQLYLSSAEVITFGTSNGTTRTTVTASTYGTLPTATWVYVFAYYDHSASAIYISVNGGAEDTTGSASVPQDGGFAFSIGRDSDGNAGGFDGRLQGVCFGKVSDITTVKADIVSFFYNSGTGRLPSSASGAQRTAWGIDDTAGAGFDLVTPASGNRVSIVGGITLTDNNTVTAGDGKVTHAPANGDAVYQWTDESGNGRHGQKTTYSQRPLYIASATDSLPGLDFDGTDDRLLIANATGMWDQANGWVVACVAEGDANDGTIIGAYNTVELGMKTSNCRNNNDTLGFTRPTGYAFYIGWYNASDTLDAIIDGAAQTGVATSDQTTANDNAIGCMRDSSPFNVLNGKVVEIMAFAGTGADPSALITNIETYLADKYPSIAP